MIFCEHLYFCCACWFLRLNKDNKNKQLKGAGVKINLVQLNNMKYLFVFMIFLSSCYSFKSLEEKSGSDGNNEHSTTGTQKLAWINKSKELKFEYDVLRNSNLYRMTTDSTEAEVFIKLEEIEEDFIGCQNPQMTVLLFTLGFYPVESTKKYTFSFTEASKEGEKFFSKQISILKTTSWFHLFSTRKSKRKAIGVSL
jgi:hypothetical protein